ncbi:hypothetical protein Bcep1808_7025 (plasmid) [Burkholderia vietnamiensis G4]|uniref:Uncharacterized protein n=1 Tax=Burkholderia vietnamiensis (strain G4 / LMG 22486) TaxID=269482 RepID=A4JUF8_BURVG|nr:hypothetical protein Bcep1808_7025 [Burkholderia vietnamiensis G4]
MFPLTAVLDLPTDEKNPPRIEPGDFDFYFSSFVHLSARSHTGLRQATTEWHGDSWLRRGCSNRPHRQSQLASGDANTRPPKLQMTLASQERSREQVFSW